MSDQDVLHTNPMPAPRGPNGLSDELILKLASMFLKKLRDGRLRLTLPSGRAGVIGGGHAELEASIDIRSYKVLSRAVQRGALGFAESYIKGDVVTEDLGQVFRFFIANFEALDTASRGVFRARLPDRLAHASNRNTRAGSRRNIAAHYDLGNDFYKLWLDPGMTYSSALYEVAGPTGLTLEEAQAAKYNRILEALDLDTSASVLEIGCGWGGMATTLAGADQKVTAITVSNEQFVAARQRVQDDGLLDCVDVRFQDYRDVSGKFDRIVSVEMIEAVGTAHWPQYFKTLSDRLADDGHAVLQAITINPKDYPGYVRRPDFIQRYIFPGGMLPTVDIMTEQARNNGMKLETITTFGADYAETLRQWRTRFEAAWPQIAALGFDENFRRMWIYYLTYCEIGFDSGVTDVGIYKVIKQPQ